MASQPDANNKLAFSSRCIPGSAADLEERARLAAFHRLKAESRACADSDRPEQEAQRRRDFDANKTKMEKDRMHKQRMQNNYVPRS